MVELRMAQYELAQLRKKIPHNDKNNLVKHIKNIVDLLSELEEELNKEGLK